MENHLGGAAIKNSCRAPDIMSDASYAIFKRDSRTCSGNFLVDEDVLKEEGVTDFEPYSVVPGINTRYNLERLEYQSVS